MGDVSAKAFPGGGSGGGGVMGDVSAKAFPGGGSGGGGGIGDTAAKAAELVAKTVAIRAKRNFKAFEVIGSIAPLGTTLYQNSTLKVAGFLQQK